MIAISIDSMDWLDDDGSWAVHHVMGFSLAIVASPYFTCCNAFAWILRNARKWSIWNCLILTYLYSKSDSVTLEMMCNAWSALLCVWDPDHWLVLSTLCMRPRSLIGPLYFEYETQIIDWSSLLCVWDSDHWLVFSNLWVFWWTSIYKLLPL